MAMVSALATMQRHRRAVLADVTREQGLSEINAKRALESLVKQGVLGKEGYTYVLMITDEPSRA